MFALFQCRPFEQIEEIHKINVLGPLAVVRAFLPLLEASKQRTIVNVTSLAGSIGFHQEALAAPEPNVFAQSGLGYTASKAALNLREPLDLNHRITQCLLSLSKVLLNSL